MADCVVGANITDAHRVGARLGRDFQVAQWADLRRAEHGDRCPHCEGGALEAHRAIELGHVFKLGTKYSEALGALFLDEEAHQRPAVMGCYGIGVSRLLAAIVEQFNDEGGIVWPLSVAPFAAVVLLLQPDDAELAAMAEGIAAGLEAEGLETLVDDRDERPGPKFKDCDLIGYPLQIVVGKKASQEGLVEVRRRGDRAERVVPVAEAVAAAKELAAGAL